jgi:hypothetical protein
MKLNTYSKFDESSRVSVLQMVMCLAITCKERKLIGVRSTLISNQRGLRLRATGNKWGQSKINFQSKGVKAKGG